MKAMLHFIHLIKRAYIVNNKIFNYFNKMYLIKS